MEGISLMIGIAITVFLMNAILVFYVLRLSHKIRILRDRGDLYKQLYKRFYEIYHVQKLAISILSSQIKNEDIEAYVSNNVYLSQETEEKIRAYERA